MMHERHGRTLTELEAGSERLLRVCSRSMCLKSKIFKKAAIQALNGCLQPSPSRRPELHSHAAAKLVESAGIVADPDFNFAYYSDIGCMCLCLMTFAYIVLQLQLEIAPNLATKAQKSPFPLVGSAEPASTTSSPKDPLVQGPNLRYSESYESFSW